MAERERLTDEDRIVQSGIREIFTPSRPIFSPDFFVGRTTQVNMLLSQINTPGQHSLLFGHRGVGKSSLANHISCRSGRKAITVRCDSFTTFQKLVHEIDRKLVQPDDGTSRQVTIPLVDAKFHDPDLSPSFLREHVGDIDGLILIDEAEAIRNTSDKRQMAEFIKHLSDSNARLKIIIIGVAEIGSDLIGAHPSIGRCLKETHLEPMSDTEIVQIVRGGAVRANLDFEPRLVEAIAHLSSGYPHFAHLLALKSAELAIVARSHTVHLESLQIAMRRSALDAENSLSAAYLKAVRSSTKMYETVLLAAATIPTIEFSASVLRAAIENVNGEKITQGSLNNYLKTLCSDDDSRILRRVKTGVYKFQDPRMRCYVQIKNERIPERSEPIPPDHIEPDFFETYESDDEWRRR